MGIASRLQWLVVVGLWVNSQYSFRFKSKQYQVGVVGNKTKYDNAGAFTCERGSANKGEEFCTCLSLIVFTVSVDVKQQKNELNWDRNAGGWAGLG